MHLHTLHSRDHGFEQLMRPLLNDRAFRSQVKNESDSDLIEHPEKIWFVAAQDGHVLGFCAAVQTVQVVGDLHWENNYVLPGHRGHGVYAVLFALRNAAGRGMPARTFVFDPLVGIHLRHGFTVVSDGWSATPDGVEHHWIELHRP